MKQLAAALILALIMTSALSCKKSGGDLPDALFDVTIKDAATGNLVARYLSSTMTGCSGIWQPGTTSANPNYIALAGGAYNGNQFNIMLSIAQGNKGVFSVNSSNLDNTTADITMNSHEAAADGGDGFLFPFTDHCGTLTISQFGISGSVIAGSFSATLTQSLSNPNDPGV